MTTVHPAVVLGPMLPGQAVSSTMGLLKQLLDGAVVPSTFGLCSAADVAAVHVAGLRDAETAGGRYLVCSRDGPRGTQPTGRACPKIRPLQKRSRFGFRTGDQYSTLEIVQMVKAGAPEAATAIDLDAWLADEKVQKMTPKKPATDNRKARALLAVGDLEAPEKFVCEAARSLHERAAA